METEAAVDSEAKTPQAQPLADPRTSSSSSPGERKRPGSPVAEENVKKLKVQEELTLEEKASVQTEAPAALESETTASADLSDVPLLPANPIPVVKNSIKLRLSR